VTLFQNRLSRVRAPFPAAFDETGREKHAIDRTDAGATDRINFAIRFFQQPLQYTPGKRAE
jgi:hypothetical protein